MVYFHFFIIDVFVTKLGQRISQKDAHVPQGGSNLDEFGKLLHIWPQYGCLRLCIWAKKVWKTESAPNSLLDVYVLYAHILWQYCLVMVIWFDNIFWLSFIDRNNLLIPGLSTKPSHTGTRHRITFYTYLCLHFMQDDGSYNHGSYNIWCPSTDW